MRLSAEVKITNGEAELFIIADKEGSDYFLVRIGRLGTSDHLHFFAPSSGGYDLTEEELGPDAMPVRHIKIYLQDLPPPVISV